MSFEEISRIVGIVSIGLLFAVKFYIATTSQVPKSIDYRMLDTLRIGVLWTSVYVFFLFVIRILAFLNIGSMEERTIVASWSTLIPLIAICVHWFLSKRLIDNQENNAKDSMHKNEKSF